MRERMGETKLVLFHSEAALLATTVTIRVLRIKGMNGMSLMVQERMRRTFVVQSVCAFLKFGRKRKVSLLGSSSCSLDRVFDGMRVLNTLEL